MSGSTRRRGRGCTPTSTTTPVTSWWRPRTCARAVALLSTDGAITGVRISSGDNIFDVCARRGVILANGGFEWDPGLVDAVLRGPMHGPVAPATKTGEELR